MLNVLSGFAFSIVSLLIFSHSVPAYASNNYCTPFQEQRGVGCVLGSQNAKIYSRQCENPCWRTPHNPGNWGPNCDHVQVCSINDPNTFEGPCSEWIKNSGVSCFNPNSQDWEQRWVRTCVVGLAEEWCSDENPN